MTPENKTRLGVVCLCSVATLAIVSWFQYAGRKPAPQPSPVAVASAAGPTSHENAIIRVDASTPAETTDFIVPGFGSTRCKVRMGECDVEGASVPWKIQIFYDENSAPVGLEYFKSGSERPKKDPEVSRTAYEARGEKGLGPVKLDFFRVAAKILEQVPTYARPDEVLFYKISAITLQHRIGTRSGEPPVRNDVFVVALYADGALPGTSNSDGARYVYDSKGEMLWIDNVLGGE